MINLLKIAEVCQAFFTLVSHQSNVQKSLRIPYFFLTFIKIYIIVKIEFALVLKKFHRNDRPYRRSRT